jgi:Tyrosine phosphatase family
MMVEPVADGFDTTTAKPGTFFFWNSSASLLHLYILLWSSCCPFVKGWSPTNAWAATVFGTKNQILRMTPSTEADNIGTANCIVSNARMGAGLPMVLRCATTDGLASAKTKEASSTRCTFDEAILEQAGLIFDLRSPSERNQEHAQAWMSLASEQIPSFSVKELETDRTYPETELLQILLANPRLVIRLDILSPNRFMKYLDQNWLSPAKAVQANLFKVVDGHKLHNLRMETLNEKGLLGLNEAILETGKLGLCTALQLMTLHLEQLRKRQYIMYPSTRFFDLVVIHCVQGKDRTGLLVMLCQALIGVSDEDMIEDYHMSHNQNGGQTSKASSAAVQRATSNQSGAVKLDRAIFNSAPRHVMQATLEYLRSEYGSIAPGYLNHIGFDASWQRRFEAVASESEKLGTGSSDSALFPAQQSKL